MQNPFKYVKEDEWRSLAKAAQVKHYKKDEVLIEEGATPKGMLAIDKGEVKVRVKPGGYTLVIAEHGPGTIFGEMSFIESAPAEVSVVAATDVEALFISHEQMKQAIEQSPVLYGNFYRSLAWLLSSRLRETTGQLFTPKEDSWRSG